MFHHQQTPEPFFRADPDPVLIREAAFAPSSWNAAERTFDVVFSTGSEVDRGSYIERLDLNQDWTSFRGAPVLNSHRRNDVDDILGSVISARTVGGEALATIRMSARPKRWSTTLTPGSTRGQRRLSRLAMAGDV
jgi:hypothetical protein